MCAPVSVPVNDLTMRLLAEGYDKDNHPDYVEWSVWGDFEYTRQALAQKIWEAPCGVIANGDGSYNHGSHLGVEYCPENDNPRYGCPYRDRDCEHFVHNGLPGWNCAFHQIVRDYDYDISLEKLEDETDVVLQKSWMEVTHGVYCDCMRRDDVALKWIPQYSVKNCIQWGCKNETCVITGKRRNLQQVNIYYDALREWRYFKGLFETVERNLEKGVRQFKKAVARTDAEIWLRKYGDVTYAPVMICSEQQEALLSEYGVGTNPKYDRYEYSKTVLNVRIECRERRDLMQDLADIAEGIAVHHASDQKKQVQQAKRDRKMKRQEAKARRNERSNISNWVATLADPETNEIRRKFARQELESRGLDCNGKLPVPETPEQVMLSGVAD